MGIFLKQARVYGFRGLKNIEIDLKPTTILVGSNNSGKTTFLKALQLALSSSFSVSIDDFYYCEKEICNKIIVDIQVIPVDAEFKQLDEFEDDWATVLTVDRISIDTEGKQSLCFRTIVEEDLQRKTYQKKQLMIDEWGSFKGDTFWYEKEYTKSMNFFFDEIPFFYTDANRDILEDLHSKTSYLGKLLSTIEYNPDDKDAIEALIRELNEMTITKSGVLTNIQKTLGELDTAMDNSQKGVSLTPFTKKVKDLNKGININYSDFSMDYHGMGTRSWSSLLILKSFLNFYKEKFESSEKVYFPIIAVEEPESHLHPNAQKKLYSQIREIVGQKIISTHSNYVAGCADLTEIRSLVRKNDQLVVGEIKESDFSPEELRKIKRQVIVTRGELLFSKLVILFEGETEEQVLPILTEKYFGKTCVELGIDFVGVGGHGNYSPFINFCDSLNIEYLIFSDNESAINASVSKQVLASKLKDLRKVVFLHEGCDFEKELIEHGQLVEVKLAYKEFELGNCKNKHHKVAREAQLAQIPDSDYHGIVSGMKTQFAAAIAGVLLNSQNPLPAKVVELFQKISEPKK